MKREGVDYKTCWTCARFQRIPRSDYPVMIDLGVCTMYRSDEQSPYAAVETDPHGANDCDDWEPM